MQRASDQRSPTAEVGGGIESIVAFDGAVEVAVWAAADGAMPAAGARNRSRTNDRRDGARTSSKSRIPFPLETVARTVDCFPTLSLRTGGIIRFTEWLSDWPKA